MAWDDDLQTIDAQPMFPSETDHTRRADIGLDADLKHVSKAERRRLLHLLHVSNAAKVLESLPVRGETFHIVMAGHFNAWDFVAAVLRLAAPATIKRLDVATLGFNQANADELITMLDAGQIGECSFICSCYFKSMSDGAPIYDALADALTKRGHRIAAMRSHAKVMAFELTDGRHITTESSANLRSCRNIEQLTMTNDRDLLLFHRSWMTDLLDKA